MCFRQPKPQVLESTTPAYIPPPQTEAAGTNAQVRGTGEPGQGDPNTVTTARRRRASASLGL